MFGNINHRQKQNEQPTDKNVQAEILLDQQQPQIQPMGNEAANANLFTQMIKQANLDTGNEFLAGLEEEENGNLSESGENIINENFINNINKEEDNKENWIDPNKSLNEVSGKIIEKIVDAVPKDNGENKEQKEAPENRDQKKDAEPRPNAEVRQNAVQDIFPDMMEEIQEFYQDPEPVQQEGQQEDELDALPADHELNTSMIVHAPKKHQKEKKNNDIVQAAAPMEMIKGLNIAVQKFPERKKASWWSRFLTGTAWYAGKTIGRAFNWLANLFIMPWFNREKKKRAFSKSPNNSVITQEKRIHDVIPGWGGKKFEKDPDREDNIIADFRRAPTVWSFRTAGKAEDEHGRPLPPKISVNVEQVKQGVDQDMTNDGAGHSGLGIEYSRYSRVSNRYERYQLKYGFYIADQTYSAMILNQTKDALTLGQLANEQGRRYDITRTFPATTKQVNDILKASETWADGGYNNLTRNCTTFVKHMVKNVAHLPVGDQIFQSKNPDVNSVTNFLGFAAVASEKNALVGMESSFEKLAAQDDLNYANFGNKRTNKEDYKVYKKSLNPDATWKKKVDLPNDVAENMRRLEGSDAGTLTANIFKSDRLKDPNNSDATIMSFSRFYLALKDECKNVKDAIVKLAGKNNVWDLLLMPGIPSEMDQLISGLDRIPEAMYEMGKESKIKQAGIQNPVMNKNFFMDPDILRTGRADLEDSVEKVNKLLFTYLKNDKRLHPPFMKLLSVLQQSMEFVDEIYRGSKLGEANNGELGDIRSEMDKKSEAKTRVQPSGGGAGEWKNVSITPTHYESYIQIYKTPEAAIENYRRYIELSEKQDKTKAEEKEFEKRDRIDSLADQFDASHRYMLEKNSYSQLDVDYAFSLSKKQREASVNGNISNHLSGEIYQSLIFEKIFGGIKQRFNNHITSLEEANNYNVVRNWLDNDLHECITRKKNDMKAIIRAIKRAGENTQNAENVNEENVLTELSSAVNLRWFEKVLFNDKMVDEKLKKASSNIKTAWLTLIADKTSQTGAEIDSLIKSVLGENNQIQT